MKLASIALALLLAGLDVVTVRAARAAVDSAAFDPPQMVTIKGYTDDAMEPFLSRDGKILFFNNLNQPSVNTDIHYAIKIDPLTFQYKGPVGGVNTKALEGVATMDRNNVFYFISPRDYDRTLETIFTGHFNDGQVSDVELLPGQLSRHEPLWFNMDVEVSADGQTLYSSNNHRNLLSGNVDDSIVFVAVKTSRGRFEKDLKSNQILKNINAPNTMQYAVAISADDLSLYFTRFDPHKREFGIYVATRPTKSAPFGVPNRIDAIQGYVEAPTVTPDNKAIYFHKKVDGHFHIFLCKRHAEH